MVVQLGTSAATLCGLLAGRNHILAAMGWDVREKGIFNAPRPRVILGDQAHSTVFKALSLIGFGQQDLEMVPVDSQGRMRTDLLPDLDDSCLVIAQAGNVCTGAFDDLETVCTKAEKAWVHVDGAFGAWAALAPKSKDKVAGIDRADSLAFDLHKWIYLPYEIGGVIVRSEQDHRMAFSLTPAYLSHGEDQLAMTGGTLPWFSDYGFQLSRGFRALKAWMAIKEYGCNKLGRIIQQNIDQAQYLADLIDASPELELLAPVTLNVVCFRYVQPNLNEDVLDELNVKILAELQEQGIAAPSSTTINGKHVLHVAHTNHRSRREDFDVLVREVKRIGDELSQLLFFNIN